MPEPEASESGADQELHRALVADLHARPAPRLRAPATVAFAAFLPAEGSSGRDAALDRARAEELAALGHDVVHEQHHEFASFTAVVPGEQGTLFAASRVPFTQEWLERVAGRRAVAVLVEVVPMPPNEASLVAFAEQHLDPTGLLISRVQERQVAVATDFRVDGQGCLRFLVMVGREVGPGRTGRVVRRLIEIETYRALSMRALDDAQTIGRRLDELEPRLLDLAERIDDPSHSTEATLHELLRVSAQLEELASRHDFRFAAAHAYEAIVADRLSVLGETRFGGRQLLGEFLALRYTPAMRTVASTEQWLARVIERAGRAGDLLRARVDVARSAQNAQLLRSLDRRSEAQLRLQQTVEGLSVVAVTYYAVALLGYLFAPLAHAVGTEKEYLQAAAIPFVLLLVWLGVRRVRRRVHGMVSEAGS